MQKVQPLEIPLLVEVPPLICLAVPDDGLFCYPHAPQGFLHLPGYALILYGYEDVVTIQPGDILYGAHRDIVGFDALGAPVHDAADGHVVMLLGLLVEAAAYIACPVDEHPALGREQVIGKDKLGIFSLVVAGAGEGTVVGQGIQDDLVELQKGRLVIIKQLEIQHALGMEAAEIL